MGPARGAAKLVVVSGYPAAGKTTLTRRLAHDLDLAVVRRDAWKPALVDLAGGWPPPTDVGRWGSAARALTEAAVRDAVSARAAVIDGNFNWSQDHEGFRALVKELGAATFEICLWGDPAVLRARWEQREGHTVDVLDRALARGRTPVTEGTGEIREIDSTDFATLDAAYQSLLEDVRWFTDRLPRKKIAAGLLVRDGSGRVLLVHQDYGNRVWNLPGGLVEAGESPADGASREALEEVGLDLVPGALLDLDHTESDSLVLVYDGGAVDAATAAAVRLQEAELDDHAWVAPADLPSHLTGPRRARVERALGVLGGELAP